jgi:hypothetical protein
MCPADYVRHKVFLSLTATEVPKVSITIHLAHYKSSLSYLFNHRVNFNVFRPTLVFMILPTRFEYFAQQDCKANTSFPFCYLAKDFVAVSP